MGFFDRLFPRKQQESARTSDRAQEHNPVKIVYILPEGDELAGQGEQLWALSLGNQLYQLQNIPVLAWHLNVDDIVRCDEPEGSIPVLREVVKPSGNRTLRVAFSEEAADGACADVVNQLLQRGIFFERSAFTHFSFNITPTDDYTWVRDYLRAKESDGLLRLYEQPEMG